MATVYLAQDLKHDWRDLFQALRDAEARFLIVGAHALAVHGVPPGTQDLDLWIDSSPDNSKRVWTALLACYNASATFAISRPVNPSSSSLTRCPIPG